MSLRISVTFLLCVVTAGVCTASSPAPRPNVIVILTDDQGWGDLSIHGNENIETPRLDGLAQQSTRFQHFYVSPVCSPTRAEFLTGRYHPRSSVYSTSAGGERMDLDEITIADYFSAAGYQTAAIGKWHNGTQFPYHPNGRGFDLFYGFCSGHWGHYYSPMLERNSQIRRGNGYLTNDFTHQAMEFITANRSQPFFLYLAYNTPHSPMQVPDQWYAKYQDRPLTMPHRYAGREDVEHTRAALAMCENIDWNVGRLLDHLSELNLSNQTIVVFFCDNGPNGYRWNANLKGRKGSTDEGGVRSPLFIRWPGVVPAGANRSEISAAIDLLPTLTDLATVPRETPRELDGTSLVPLLTPNGQPFPRDRLLFSHWNNRVSVRSQRFRLDHNEALYDIDQDPEQREDIGQQFPDVHRRLKQAASNWRDSVLSSQERSRAFIISHPDYDLFHLPARDAKPSGNIVRSNRFPNCSFLTNWRSIDDRIEWDAQSMDSGTYRATVYYACPARSIGTELELRFGEHSVRKTIETAHDPPLVGAQHDRVHRQESYVKHFRPLELGSIELEKNRQTLTLRATKIPGDRAIDFRLLVLEQQRSGAEP